MIESASRDWRENRRATLCGSITGSAARSTPTLPICERRKARACPPQVARGSAAAPSSQARPWYDGWRHDNLINTEEEQKNKQQVSGAARRLDCLLSGRKEKVCVWVCWITCCLAFASEWALNSGALSSPANIWRCSCITGVPINRKWKKRQKLLNLKLVAVNDRWLYGSPDDLIRGDQGRSKKKRQESSRLQPAGVLFLTHIIDWACYVVCFSPPPPNIQGVSWPPIGANSLTDWFSCWKMSPPLFLVLTSSMAICSIYT